MRVLSGIQPTGEKHLGNYVGAIRRWVAEQHEVDAFHPIVDLHAITVPQDPEELRESTLDLAALLIASGLDPDVCTLFVQSHVPEHPRLVVGARVHDAARRAASHAAVPGEVGRARELFRGPA